MHLTAHVDVGNEMHTKVSAWWNGSAPMGVVGIELGGTEIFGFSVKLRLSEKINELLVEAMAESSLDLVLCYPY